jgi:glycosyltransferase involved in cell wall biosynthesis
MDTPGTVINLGSPIPPKAVIGLFMIVKNESKIITRCLESIKGFADFICICDTGSEDDTRIKIRDFSKDNNIPCKVHKHVWKNFGHNRTRSFKAAVKAAEKFGFALKNTWLLCLDADFCLQNWQHFDKTILTADTSADVPSYMIEIHTGQLTYPNLRLMHATEEHICVRRAHEVFITKNKERRGKEQVIPTLWIHDYDDGGNKATKYERELELLLEDREDDPNDARTYFYLGRTYGYTDRHKEAIRSYRKCARLTSWDEERWYCKYAIASCHEKLGNWKKALAKYLKAYQSRPSRSEPLHRIAEHYWKNSEHHTAMIYAQAGITIRRDPKDILFIETDVYKYQFYLDMLVCSYYIGKRSLGLMACEHLRRIPHEEISWRDRQCAGSNLQYYVNNLEQTLNTPLNSFSLLDLIQNSGLMPQMELEINDPAAGRFLYNPMNPNILWYPKRSCYLINVRFVNYHIVNGTYDIHHPKKMVLTRNFILVVPVATPIAERSLTVNSPIANIFELIVPERLIPNKRREDIQGLEDCRMVLNPDDPKRLWWTATNWEYHDIDGPQIVACSLVLTKLFPKNKKSKKGKSKIQEEPTVRRINIDNIVPLASPFGNKCEKNWLPFAAPEGIRWIYDSGPQTTIISYSALTASTNMDHPLQATIESRHAPKINISDFRGSAGPIRVSEFWLYVIHEVLPIDGPRKYLTRFVTMNLDYQVMGYSKPFYIHNMEVEYVCGMDCTENTVILTYGRMDNQAHLLQLPLASVLNSIEPIH